MKDQTALDKRSELEGRLAEKRKQLVYSGLFLALWGIVTLYNLKARMFALAVITMVLFGVYIVYFNSNRRSVQNLEQELRLLSPGD